MTELPTELIGEFMTALVDDPARAELLLAEHPLLLNARWMNNETVLHYLAIEGFEDAVRFLVAHGAEVNPVNMFGDSPLVDVAGLGRDRIAAILLAAGADPNGPSTPDRDRPLHSAARQGYVEVVALLLHAGADPHCAGSFGDTIFQAVDETPSASREQILALLAERGVVAGAETEEPDDT